MRIYRQALDNTPSTPTPSVVCEPEASRGVVVVIHGYGGCKEEQLGLAWRLAEVGLTTYAIDLPGHGENSLPLGERVLETVEKAVEYCRAFGQVAVVGHSLGGRLGLLSNADFKIGISPAIETTYSDVTKQILYQRRGHRVVEPYPMFIFDLVQKLPVWHPKAGNRQAIIFGSQDVPEIISACKDLSGQGVRVNEVKRALHSDIFLHEETFLFIKSMLKEWFLQESK